MKEDFRLSLRSIQTRIVESILLIVGIALGIGATAAGFAMVIRSVNASNELLSNTRYREILVTVREEAEDMDLPAVVQESDERIILTSADLAAREVSEDIQYAYLMNRAQFPLGLPDFQRFGQILGGGQGSGQGPGGGAAGGERPEGARGAQALLGPPPEGSAEVAPPGPEPAGGEVRVEPSDGESVSSDEDDTAPRRPGEGGPQPQWFQQMQERLQSVSAFEGPEPVLDEMEGYMVSPEFFSAWELHPAAGSLFTLSDIQQGKSVLVLGSELARTLFEDGESLNRQVVMRMEIFDIVGTLEPTGTDFDTMAFAPVFMPDIQGAAGDMMRRFIGWNTNLYFTVADSSRLDEARSQLTSYFGQEYGPGLVNITIPREEVQQAQDRTSRLVTIILFLALSGLLIAGANVSNILFSRALRRRRTVGILKALGASIAAVFKMFFWEALFISVGGAILGAGLSVALSKLMQTTMDFAAISGFMLAVGVFLSWLITKALTILPSVQASKIPAAEAIRYE